MSEEGEQNTETQAPDVQATDQEPEFTTIIVKVGFDGERRPVKFTGRHLIEDSTHTHVGPNQNRWHEFDLYAVPGMVDGGFDAYRVLDHYRTCFQGETGHYSLTESISAKEVLKRFPHLGAQAIEEGIFDADLDAEELAPDQAAPAAK